MVVRLDVDLPLEHRLSAAAEGSGRLELLSDQGVSGMSWADVHQLAMQGATRLAEQGYGPGTTIALIGRSSLEQVVAVRAAWLIGAAVMFVALPNSSRRRGVAERRLSRMNRIAPPDLVIGTEDLPGPGLVDQAASLTTQQWNVLYSSGSSGSWVASTDIDRRLPAVIQFTSGTTDEPKGLAISRYCLDRNLSAIAGRLELSSDDSLASWLPLSHDMGLIGMLGLPMSSGVDLVLSDTSTFAKNPHSWMDACSRYGTTITGGPSFAYGIAASLLHSADHLDLGRLRFAVNGAEQVDVGTFERFIEAGAKFGLDGRAAFPVYGLAEATLAVTFPAPGSGLRSQTISQRNLESRKVVEVDRGTVGSTTLALLGSPLDGVEVDISLADGAVPGSDVGEILIRGESVINSYMQSEPEVSAALKSTPVGWVETGDLGYLVDGNLVVCGRSKDTIIVAGRNIFPSEMETRIGMMDGVYRGRVVAVGVKRRGSERVGIVIEREDDGDDSRLSGEVQSAILEGWDLKVDEIILTDPGSIPRTTSGKVSRSQCRQLFFEGGY